MEFDKLLLADVGHDSDDTSTTVPWLDFADGTLRRSIPGGYVWYTGPAMLPLPGFVWMAPITKARVPPHSSHDDTLLKSS